MKLIAVSCNECGAKLSVGETSRFVTCKHCETQLAVHHEAGATFTEVTEAARRVEASADAIEAHAETLTSQNEVLLVERKIARLDRDWENARGGLMHRSKDGSLHPATRGQALILVALIPLIFVPLLVPQFTRTTFEVPTFVWLFFVAMATLLGVVALRFFRMAERYEVALKNHESERGELLQELDALAPAARPAKARKRSSARRKRD